MAINAIYRAGGRVHGQFSGPDWLNGWLASAALDGLATVGTVILDNPGLSEDQLEKLGEFPSLHTLFVDTAGFSDQEIFHLPPMPGLRTLHIENGAFGDEGLASLSSRLPNLEYLRISTTHVNDAGLGSLYSLRHLTYVELRAPKLTTEGVDRLRKAHPTVAIAVNVPETRVGCYFAEGWPLR